MRTFVKDPDDVLDFLWDWSDWLAESETIATSQMLPTADVTLDSSSNTTTTATAWLSGGTAGVNAQVTNRITTNQGRTRDETILLQIRER